MMKIIGMILLIVCVCIVVFCVLVVSTGKKEIQKFYEEDGSILEGSVAERMTLPVNGRENGLIIRGKNESNPVLLFISGGPGVPQYWLNEFYKNNLEEQVTVCWWDWRGEGLSYDTSIKPEEITTDQLVADAKVVAKYLKERFGKEKIYLMAHSGGTPLGLRIAQSNAEDFYCYFSMGQFIQEDGSRYTAGYEYLKPYFESKGMKKELRQLEKLMKDDGTGKMVPVHEETIAGPWESLLIAASCGTTREMKSDALEIFLPQMLSKCYDWREKINYWKGVGLNKRTPYAGDEIKLHEKPCVIPIYFISGRYDYTCPVTLVQQLYQNIEAPKKDIFLFESSAHSPLWEENDAVIEVMQSIMH